jgi:hypothetical protein
MSTILDRYERQATILPLRSAGAREDLIALAVDEARTWKQIDRAIAEGGDPTMLAGGYAGLELTPQPKDFATITGSATEQALWPVASTAVPANPGRSILYRLFAWGTSTTAATPGTYTLAARLGTANTSPLFGAVSGNLTPVASATAAHWRCFGLVYLRAAVVSGAATGSFEFNHSGTVGGGGPVSATGNAILGGNSATIDFTTLASAGLWMGVTHATSTTNTWVPQFVGWGSWS